MALERSTRPRLHTLSQSEVGKSPFTRPLPVRAARSRARASQARASPARAPGAPGWRHAGGATSSSTPLARVPGGLFVGVHSGLDPLPHSLALPPPSAAPAALRLGRHPRAMNPPPPAAQLRPTPCSSDAWRIAPGRPLACFFAVTCDSSEALHAPRDTGCSVVHDVVEWLRSLSPRPNRGPLPALDIGPMRFNSVYSVMGRVTTGGRPPRRRARGGKRAAPRHGCPGRPHPGRGGHPSQVERHGREAP